MKILLLPILLILFTHTAFAGDEKPRVIILADMGNEPDEEQQMVHMLHHANEFDIEGLIAVTGKYLKRDPQAELFFKLLEAYDEVVDNLRLHAPGYPSAAQLLSVVASGQYKYGMADVKAKRKSTNGSRLIERAMAKKDPRPLYIIVNAGSNTLAQALVDYQSKVSEKEFKRATSALRVFENGSQDNAGAWILKNYPSIHWVRSNYQTYAYGGPGGDGVPDNKGDHQFLGPYTWEPYAYSPTGQHQWALEHVKGDHGPLAQLWPVRQFRNGRVSFLEGGGTIPWLALVNKGLYDINNPHWGGWAGRYTRKKIKNYWSKHSDIKVDEKKFAPFYVFGEEKETWVNPETGDMYQDNLYSAVWRWRRAMFNNQKARADWAIKPYAKANHHPIAAIGKNKSDSIILKKVKAGKLYSFDASKSSDPDNDELTFHWWVYKEAGTYDGELELSSASAMKAKITIPKDAKGKEIHLILELKDNNKIAELYDYRRIVLNVN